MKTQAAKLAQNIFHHNELATSRLRSLSVRMAQLSLCLSKHHTIWHRRAEEQLHTFLRSAIDRRERPFSRSAALALFYVSSRSSHTYMSICSQVVLSAQRHLLADQWAERSSFQINGYITIIRVHCKLLITSNPEQNHEFPN